MPCCRQSSMAIVHTMFIFANSKSKKYATTQLFKSLETHLLWIFPYSLEVEINNGFWSENSKNHLRERFPKDRCSNLQSFLLFIQSTLDLPNGIFAWWNGKCINDFTLTSTKKKKRWFVLTSQQHPFHSVVQMFITGQVVHEHIALQLAHFMVYQKEHLKATPFQCSICQIWRETAEWMVFFQLQGWKTLERAWGFRRACCPFLAVSKSSPDRHQILEESSPPCSFHGDKQSLSFSACLGRRFDHPWVREGGTPSQNRKVIS